MGIALVCLIGALGAIIVSKKQLDAQEEKIRLNPYASVDKKEIDKVLDLISSEEKRRQRAEDFAAGRDVSSADIDAASDSADNNDYPEEEELRFLLIDDGEDDIEPHDEDKKYEPTPTEENDTEIGPEDEPGNDTNEGEEEEDMAYGYDDYDDRAPRRRPAEGGERRDRERDPYYEEDYYADRPRQRASRDPRDARDPYARDRRDPYDRGVYYNEYGEPVRRRRPAYDPYYDEYYDERPRQRSAARDPRDARDPYGRGGVYYNEYGEPVRRRPAPGYDDRRPVQQRRRRPEGYPDGRAPRYEDDQMRRPAPAAPSVPSQSAAIDDTVDVISTSAPSADLQPKAPEYDENYVPVVIPDDDYDYDSARASHTGRAGVGSLDRPSMRDEASPYRASEPPAPPRMDTRSDDYRYSTRDEDESIPVALPDDDYFESRYADREDPYRRDSYRQTPPPPPASAYSSPEHSGINPGHPSPSHIREKYVPSYEEEEAVVSLPRDDEYDSYVEKKREEEELAQQQRLKEQRKAERRASGKIVLSIVKIRRRKIRRKSRKYKNFRASVHHLGEYLHSFSKSGQ